MWRGEARGRCRARRPRPGTPAPGEEAEAVAQITADAIRAVYDDPGTFAEALAPHAARFGLRRGDGLALLRWLLDLVGDPETSRWLAEARESTGRRETAGVVTSSGR